MKKKEELDKWYRILLVDIRNLSNKVKDSKCKEKDIFLIDFKAIETRIEDLIEILNKEENIND